MRTRSFFSLLVLVCTLVAVAVLGAFARPHAPRDAWVAAHGSRAPIGSDAQSRCRRIDAALPLCVFSRDDSTLDGPAGAPSPVTATLPASAVLASSGTLQESRAPYIDRAFISYFANAPPV